MWQDTEMSKDFEQQLANVTDEHGVANDRDVLNILADAMTLGDTPVQSEESGAPNADTTTPTPAEPAATPAPAPAAPAPAPAAPAPAPAPAADTNADPDAIPEGKTPVVLAKDGVHTISYDKLVEARQKAADLAAENARQAAELAELKAAKAAPAPAPAAPAAAPAPATDEPLFGDYTDADLRKGVEKLLDQRTAALRAEFEGKLKPVEVDRVVQAQREHLATIYQSHPDAESIVASQEFAAWEKAQPKIVQQAIAATLEKGAAGEVVEVLDLYRAAHPSQAPAPVATPAAAPVAATPAAAKPSVEALAAKAIADAKTNTPTTLSDIPSGGQAVTDEASAMEQATPVALLDKLSGMTPDQIDVWMTRMV